LSGPDPDKWQDAYGAPPPGTALGPAAAIADGEAREYSFGKRGAFSMFVVRKGDDFFAYLNACPHLGSRLNERRAGFLTEDGGHIRCSAHHSAFRIKDGFGIAGESEGCWLDPIAIVIDKGTIRIAG
jgi:nitrite reductase/ring-hydroxylating ferredoxin subunit